MNPPGKKQIAIVGAGAAGCFCAAQLHRMAGPAVSISLYEAGRRPLAKVAVTGGGRCNLTNTFEGIRSLSEAYPRGERLLSRALKAFSQRDTMAWFEAEGVALTVQPDHCVFPRSQDAGEIVRTLLRAIPAQMPVHTGMRLQTLRRSGERWALQFRDGTSAEADAVVVTTGGAPKGVSFLEEIAIEQVPPVPSLFSFVVRDAGLQSLMGLVIPEASVSLPGTPYRGEGPLLLTDWGLSGPAVLRLSSYAARHLADKGYAADLSVNWTALPEDAVREKLHALALDHPQKQLSSTPLPGLPARLWGMLLSRAGLREDLRWAELGSKGKNRLVATLTADPYRMTGRNPFREEFVTCGGVALSGVNLTTLEARRFPGLYFAGEVLDVDAVTGGFNLQAAWSTGYCVARSLAALCNP